MPDAAPTMIIPAGTEIQVDVHGQLSIRTPGNLVIQNSGNYGTIESAHGSIRIEPDVQVEAVEVRCADVCYVQGSLTAWKVRAQTIQLEESARAHIILQETESLQIGKQARMVGNFSSEKELFLLFSRFANQMRAMPFGLRGEEPLRELAPPRQRSIGPTADGSPDAATAEAWTAAPSAPMPPPPDGARPEVGRDAARGAGAPDHPRPGGAEVDLPEELTHAMVLLEREIEQGIGGPTSRDVASRALDLLRRSDLETLRRSHRQLFGEVVHPTPDLSRARQLIEASLG